MPSRTLITLTAALAISLAATAPAGAAPPPVPPPGVHNVALALDQDHANKQDGGLVAFQVDELKQGALDRNLDGDWSDQVLAVYDGSTGTTTNLRLASGTVNAHQIAGDLVAMRVREASQGNTDLNGDGDTADDVVHVYDASTNTTTNLELAPFGTIRLGSGVLAFSASEPGEGADLNGDGDMTDSVPHVWEPGDPAATNLGATNPGLDSPVPAAAGSLASFEVNEGGTDRNSDGDTTDSVLYVYDGTNLVNTGLEATFAQLTPQLATTNVSESDQGNIDLNGDGDTADHVLHVFELGAGATNTQRPAQFGVTAVGDVVAWSVGEAEHGGADLDGDGDATGHSMHTFDAATNQTVNLGIGADNFSAPQISGDVVAFLVDEHEGAADLNGDGDASDRVLHTRDTATSTTTNLGLDVLFPIDFGGQGLVFMASESGQGDTDLNGDGDVLDAVLHVRTGTTTTNLQLEGAAPVADGDLIAFMRGEGSGAGDLNGDGDMNDAVPFVHNLDHDLTTNIGLATFALHPLLNSGSLLSFSVSETGQGNTNRNGDGGTTDNVLAVYDLSDPDDDGLGKADEVALGTGQADPDSDDDGLLDGREVWVHDADPLDTDTDNDNLSDGAEVNTHTSDPDDSDTDNDGIQDGAEVNTHNTDPTDTDTDNDGLSDGAEVNTHATGPTDPDTDDDGIQDGSEVNTHNTDPKDVDTDNDTLEDGDELVRGTGPLDADSDDDGIADGAEVRVYGSNPTDADTDDDGVRDGFDNCVMAANAGQADGDGDGLGDACDAEAAQPEPTDPPSPEPFGPTPPETSITDGPKKLKQGKRGSFEFSSSEAGSSFECALDNGGFAPCTSPRTVKTKKLDVGKHSLKVRAIDGDGVLDASPASRGFKVTKPR